MLDSLSGVKETTLNRKDQDWITKNKLMNHHDDVKRDIYNKMMELGGGYGEFHISLYTEQADYEEDKVLYRSRYTVKYEGDDSQWVDDQKV